MTPFSVPDVSNGDIRFPPGSALTAWTPGLTSDNTDPTLGTAAVQYGRIISMGGFVFAPFHIQFGTSGVNAGVGNYRIPLPIPCNPDWYEHKMQVGMGHIHDADGGYIGLGPGAYRHVLFHLAPIVQADEECGIVLGMQPRNVSQTYTLTNASSDRALNANGADAMTLVTELRGYVAELADVVSTFIQDSYTNSRDPGVGIDGVAATVPWAWAASDEINGFLLYEAAE